jgi:hypothetical protein
LKSLPFKAFSPSFFLLRKTLSYWERGRGQILRQRLSAKPSDATQAGAISTDAKAAAIPQESRELADVIDNKRIACRRVIHLSGSAAGIARQRAGAGVRHRVSESGSTGEVR